MNARIAWRIACANVARPPDVLIGLCMQRSLDMVVANRWPSSRRRGLSAADRPIQRRACRTCLATPTRPW